MRFKEDVQSGGGLYVKMKDGESITGVFRGDPVEFQKAFKPGESAKFRFKINFVTLDGGVLVSKIFENGAMVYEQLRDLHKEYDLAETKVKIMRKGTELNTTYVILPTKDQLTDKQKQLIADVELQKLTVDQTSDHNTPPPTPRTAYMASVGNSEPWPSPDDEIPF